MYFILDAFGFLQSIPILTGIIIGALYLWVKYLNNELWFIKPNITAKRRERSYVKSFMKNGRSPAKLWLDLGDSPKPYRIKSWVERKSDTSNPVNEIEYWAYGNIETKDFSEDEYEIDKKNSTKAGEDIIIKLIGKEGMSADKRKIQLQARQIDSLLDLLDSLNYQINNEVKDPRVQKILGRQIEKAINSASTMEAWGNDAKGDTDGGDKTSKS